MSHGIGSGFASVVTESPEQTELLRRIGDMACKRADVSFAYAAALRNPDAIDWPKVNRAIARRWSAGGLRWIKDQAWKAVS